MAENYKHLYEQMKKMVAMYQDEIVPGLRKTIEEMERNRVEVVRCKDCVHWEDGWLGYCAQLHTAIPYDGFCCYGVKKERRNG